MRPIIGLTVSIQTDEKRLFTPTSYPSAIIAAGGIPVLLNITSDPEQIAQYADMVDGVLFSGGDDVNPAVYGEAQHWNCGDISPLRDAFEMQLLRTLLEKHPDKPILAICRGEQVANVSMGGTLYQDLHSQLPDCIRHQQKQISAYASHRAEIVSDTRLHAIYGADEVMVNSFHHQAVKEVGTGLIVSARAEDGVIEAIEKPDHPYFVAVQWHPERLVEHDAASAHKALFSSFVQACRK